ncbi:MAG TPA: hypothetical protein VFB63_01540 [Bryobacteraceae bacterium]|nr:hypothetical protein [Bryobacteraceae bacterium]
MPRLNRRQLTQTLLTGAATAAVGASLSSQAPSSEPAADDLLAAAKRQIASNRETLDRIKLPMATEPASVFKAI